MTLNMGPQHPSTHGVLRLVLRTDGEIVSEVTPQEVGDAAVAFMSQLATAFGIEDATTELAVDGTDLDSLRGTETDDHQTRGFEREDLPDTTVAKIVGRLKRAGLVEAERGRNADADVAVAPMERARLRGHCRKNAV